MKQLAILAIILLSFASAISQTYHLPEKSLFREAKILVNDTNFINCTSLSIKLNDTVSFFNAKTKRREEYHLGELNYIMVKDRTNAGIGGLIGATIGLLASQSIGFSNGRWITSLSVVFGTAAVGYVIGGNFPKWNTYYINDTYRRGR